MVPTDVHAKSCVFGDSISLHVGVLVIWFWQP
jgi:hypothetical protein